METGNNEIQDSINDLKLIFNLDYQGFSYTTFNTRNKCFSNIEFISINQSDDDFLEKFEYLINEKELNKEYKNVLGSFNPQISTFIPEPLFDQKNITNYIKLIGEKEKTHITQYLKQKFINCYSIYTINDQLLVLLKSIFKPLNLKSTSSIFLDYVLSLNTNRTRKLFLQIYEHEFHIILIQHGEFQFYNKFEFKNKLDFIYYFMNCLKVLELESNTLDVQIITDLEKDHEIFYELKKHINTIFLERPINFLYDDNVLTQSIHKNHNLFSQIICE